MRATMRAEQELCKSAGAKICPPKGKSIRKILPFELFLREIWPEDRTKNYMRLTGAKESTAKLRVRGKFAPDYSEIVMILGSPLGWEWIKYALGDQRPEWFADVERAKNISETRKAHAALSRRIAQLEMEIE